MGGVDRDSKIYVRKVAYCARTRRNFELAIITKLERYMCERLRAAGGCERCRRLGGRVGNPGKASEICVRTVQGSAGRCEQIRAK